MNTRSPFRTTLVGLAIGVLLALLIAPQSRWLVRWQLALVGLTVGTPFGETPAQEGRTQRVAAAHPADFPMQMAALPGRDTGKFVASLRTLTARFGDNPSLYANLLRYEVRSDTNKQGVYLSRPEESELSSNRPAAGAHTLSLPIPAVLAAFDADAARGEQIDPSNAYFPLMRAIGLFAAHRDAEGLAAVQRASDKPVWNEYLADEVNGRIHLADAAYGHGMSISHIAVAASELYPEYAPLRSMARLVVVLAMHAEQHGDRAGGMSIRRALMQDGDLMRVQAPSYIGDVVGIAISAIARSRPGGAAATKRPKQLTSDQWAQMHMEAFATYARQAGFPDNAARAEAQYAAGEIVRRLGKQGIERSVLSLPMAYKLGAGWIGSTLALVNAFWLVVLGLVGTVLSRLPSVQTRQPLSVPARWGANAAFALAVSIVALLAAESDMRPAIALTIVLGIAGAVAMGALTLRRGSEQRRQTAAAFAQAFGMMALVLVSLAFIAAWQTHCVLQSMQVGSGAGELSGGGGRSNEPSPLLVGLIAAGIGLIVPAVLAIVVSICARKRRVPVFAALADGFQRMALPLACVLVIGYGVAAMGTLRQEQRMDDGLRQMIRHEGRYYASLAGIAWPGPA